MLILDQHKVLVSMVGKDVVARAIASLPDDVREEYEHLSPVSWCRISTEKAAWQAVAREAGRDPVQFHYELTRLGIERTFKGVWKVLLRYTSDEALMKRTAMIYSKTLSVGRITSEIPRPGTARVLHEGWPGMDSYDVSGLGVAIEAILKVAGREQVKVSWTGRPPMVRFLASWKR